MTNSVVFLTVVQPRMAFRLKKEKFAQFYNKKHTHLCRAQQRLRELLVLLFTKSQKKFFPPNNSCGSEYSSFTTRSISTSKRVDLKSKPFAYCCAYSMFNYIDRLVVCLSDFAKRCPLSFGLKTGIAHVQASVDGKKPGGLLSC